MRMIRKRQLASILLAFWCLAHVYNTGFSKVEIDDREETGIPTGIVYNTAVSEVETADKEEARTPTGPIIQRRCLMEYFTVIKKLKLEQCPLSKKSVFMIWTTAPETFTPRNQWAVESVFKHNPCLSIKVYSNTLPLDFFATYAGFGLDIGVIPYTLRDGSFGLSGSAPGQKWAENIIKWKEFPFFHVHASDFLRLVVLYEHGGTYIDMDHINIGPLFVDGISKLGENVIGSEVCSDDNPDCLSITDLESLQVLDSTRVNNLTYPSRDGFHSFNSLGSPVRYTPCNGVLVNWQKQHPLIGAALRHTDNHYDPSCWGCMGPRLMGLLLLNKVSEQHVPKASSPLSFDMQVLAPGLLYPFDYRDMAPVMRTRSAKFDALIRRSQPHGVHFFGTVSTPLVLEINSTMGVQVRENSLFGNLPYTEVLRKPDSSFCYSAPEDIASIRKNEELFLTKNSLTLGNIMMTHPSDLNKFHEMARKTGTILVCHKDWLGIRQMTVRIADHLSIPVMMVGDTTLNDHMVLVKQTLEVMGVRHLHFQGIPPWSLEFTSYLRSTITPHAVLNKFIFEWVVSVSYHSGIAVHNIACDESVLLGRAMTAAANGNILLTFLESDQAEFASRLGAPACAVLPTFVDQPSLVRHQSLHPSQNSSTLRVGLLGSGTRLAVKNYFTQIGAACMFRDAEIHVNTLIPPGLTTDDAKYWHISRCGSSIVEHGHLDSGVFLKEVSTFDINLHVSWTDAVPNTVLDSLSAGVPVIVSDVTPIFDYSPKLKSLLVESRIDDPAAIYKRAVRVLEYVEHNRQEFQADVFDLFKILREKAFSSWQCFLNSTEVDKKCSSKSGDCLSMLY